MSTKWLIFFVCVGLIDHRLKTRSHPCLSFKNIIEYCCCGHHKVCINVGRNWREFSTVSAYQPCNKGSLWVCRRRRHELSVQQPGLVFEEPQAGLMSSSLNSAPPSLGMETGAKTVVPATDMWGAWRGKKKKRHLGIKVCQPCSSPPLGVLLPAVTCGESPT